MEYYPSSSENEENTLSDTYTNRDIPYQFSTNNIHHRRTNTTRRRILQPSSTQRKINTRKRIFYTKKKTSLLNMNIVKYSVFVVLVSYVYYLTHKREEVIQEVELYLPEEQIMEQTQIHPFLSYDEELSYYNELHNMKETTKDRVIKPPSFPNFALPSYTQNKLTTIKPKSVQGENKLSFCGTFTKTASKLYPNLYRNPLNHTSVVILSGILSPLGFHLAHALKACNVSKIIGIDPMLPNNYNHRMQQLNYMNNLYKIDSLHAPIYQGFMGIEPIVTGLDLNRFHYTHIMHVTPFAGYGNTTTMIIRQNAIAMEQLLSSTSQNVSFLYVTNTRQKHIHDLLTVLSHTYASIYGISTVNLQIGRIYGPYVPKPLDGKHMLDTIYVKDAVDAIITASQLSTNYNIQLKSGNIVSQKNHKLTSPTNQKDTLLHWTSTTKLDKGSMYTFYYKQIMSNPYTDIFKTKILNDLYMTSLPCASECSMKECVKTSLDDIIPTTQYVSKSCDVILYTSGVSTDPIDSLSFLDEDDEDIKQYTNLKICKILFLRDDSPILTIPPILQFLNYTSDQFHQNKNQYNGKLQIDEWILIICPPVTNINGDSMLKLSPGKFFSTKVKYAMYYELNFNVIPKLSDVLFLISCMYRKARKERTIKIDDDSIILPPEPNRKAALLAAKRKNIPLNSKSIRHIIKLRNITISKKLDTQRQFYERLLPFFNRQYWKNPNDYTYKYQMKHFIRSYWIVHNLKVEEGRLLRCDWLNEHYSWDEKNGVDEISLAYVLSKREMERKLFLHALDDYELSSYESTSDSSKKYPKSHVIDKHTDRKEWESLLTTQQYLDYHKNGFPHRERKDRDVQALLNKEYNSNETQIAVRIISDESMIAARKKWKLAMMMKIDNQKKVATMELNLEE